MRTSELTACLVVSLESLAEDGAPCWSFLSLGNPVFAFCGSAAGVVVPCECPDTECAVTRDVEDGARGT